MLRSHKLTTTIPDLMALQRQIRIVIQLEHMCYKMISMSGKSKIIRAREALLIEFNNNMNSRQEQTLYCMNKFTLTNWVEVCHPPIKIISSSPNGTPVLWIFILPPKTTVASIVNIIVARSILFFPLTLLNTIFPMKYKTNSSNSKAKTLIIPAIHLLMHKTKATKWPSFFSNNQCHRIKTRSTVE